MFSIWTWECVWHLNYSFVYILFVIAWWFFFFVDGEPKVPPTTAKALTVRLIKKWLGWPIYLNPFRRRLGLPAFSCNGLIFQNLWVLKIIWMLKYKDHFLNLKKKVDPLVKQPLSTGIFGLRNRNGNRGNRKRRGMWMGKRGIWIMCLVWRNKDWE